MNTARTIGAKRISQATATLTGLGVTVAAAAIGLATIPSQSPAVTTQLATDAGTTSSSSDGTSTTVLTGVDAGQAAPVAHSSGS